MKKISTSKLAETLNVDVKDLFKLLQSNWLIESINNKWTLTSKWKEYWWVIIQNFKYGDYIAWDENFNPYTLFKIEKINYITSTELAPIFSTTSRKFNLIISELGYIEKTIKWWGLTKVWAMLWWKEIEHSSGKVFVKWPESFKENTLLLKEFHLDKWSSFSEQVSKQTSEIIDNFRDKFPANYRTKDGHNVRSRWEVIIDNMLYEYWLVHAYERKLPVEEDVYSDFYIPARLGSSAVYIEYWGKEDSEYIQRRKIKQEIYKKYNLNLIELENNHIDNLDDYLPKMLLNFWIKVD